MAEDMPRLAEARHVGTRLRRREDPRLVTGRAQHVGDLRLPGTVHASIVRSPFAHARIASIDRAAARAAPGVLGVYTASDLDGRVDPMVESALEDLSPRLAELVDLEVRSLPMPVLATDRVRWLGQPVAAVVATDPYLAEDAAALVQVDYDPLPAVASAEAALEPGALVLHPELPDNVHARLRVTAGDVDRARSPGRITELRERFEMGRQISERDRATRRPRERGEQRPHDPRDEHQAAPRADVRLADAPDPRRPRAVREPGHGRQLRRRRVP
jgi:carbon-monoxide dehydrogenase large subunit